jgi:hypothetical protein
MRLEHKRKGARVASTLGSKGEQTAPRRLRSEGFGPEQLGEMQKIINAEKSDLFDVLAYVAYALPPLNREERASRSGTSRGYWAGL